MLAPDTACRAGRRWREAHTPAGSVTSGLRREWLSYRESETLVGLSRTTLWKLIGVREIECRRVGRAVRINRASLEAYTKKPEQPSAADTH